MNKKTIFITGAASGIGKSTALLFANKGWFVGLYDIDEKGLSALHQEIGSQSSCYKVLDVSDPESVEPAVKHFSKATNGKMDILFNNAGIFALGRFEDIPLAKHHAMMRVNVEGILNCIHTSIAMLKNTPDSRIINTSSATALHGVPEHASYSATKFAIRSLTEGLQIEFEQYGITVCDIMPIYVKTPMITEREGDSGMINKMGVTLTPDDIAKGVWKSAHSRKVHRIIGGLEVHILATIAFLPNMLTRFIFKKAIA
ncbi:MAG: SDR family oxidoreductase [Bermanella sp.]